MRGRSRVPISSLMRSAPAGTTDSRRGGRRPVIVIMSRHKARRRGTSRRGPVITRPGIACPGIECPHLADWRLRPRCELGSGRNGNQTGTVCAISTSISLVSRDFIVFGGARDRGPLAPPRCRWRRPGGGREVVVFRHLPSGSARGGREDESETVL